MSLGADTSSAEYGAAVKRILSTRAFPIESWRAVWAKPVRLIR